MHGDGVELDLGAFVVGVELRHRAEGGDAGVVAEDRDVAAGELVGERLSLHGVGEIVHPHLDGDAVLAGEAVGEGVQQLTAARDDDQRVSAGGECGGEGFADAGRRSGHDGTGIGSGCGEAHDRSG